MNVVIKNAKGQVMPPIERITGQKYLGAYNTLVYEDEARGLTNEKVDSILANKPFTTMRIVSRKGVTTNLSFYRIKNGRVENDENGNPLLYNPDRIHCRVNNERKLYVMQYYVWDRALVPIGFFAPQR